MVRLVFSSIYSNSMHSLMVKLPLRSLEGSAWACYTVFKMASILLGKMIRLYVEDFWSRNFYWKWEEKRAEQFMWLGTVPTSTGTTPVRQWQWRFIWATIPVSYLCNISVVLSRIPLYKNKGYQRIYTARINPSPIHWISQLI